MLWRTPQRRGEQSRLPQPGCARGSRLNAPRRFALQPASVQELANIVTCSAGTSGKEEQCCCSRNGKKENTYEQFCVTTHLTQTEHRVRPRNLGRRLVL